MADPASTTSSVAGSAEPGIRGRRSPRSQTMSSMASMAGSTISSPMRFPSSAPGTPRSGFDRLNDTFQSSPLSHRRELGSVRRATVRGRPTPGTPGTPGGGGSSRGGEPATNPSTNPSGANDDGDDAETEIQLWGTNIDMTKLNYKLKQFMTTFRDPETDTIKYPDIIKDLQECEDNHIDVDGVHIESYDSNLYLQFIKFPAETILALDAVVNDIYRELTDDDERAIQVRIHNLDETTNMRELNPKDIDTLVAIKGMVIRVPAVTPELKEATFQCTVCKFQEKQDLEGGRIKEPTKCTNCNTERSMELMHNRSVFSDRQNIKMQETPDFIPEGQTPHTLMLHTFDELCDSIVPGDRVEVTGIYRAVPLRSNNRHRTLKAVYRTYIDVVHFSKKSENRIDQMSMNVDEVLPESEEDHMVKEFEEIAARPTLYEDLTFALAPSVWELDDVKRGLLLQMFGGTHKTMVQEGRGRFRGEINILLCGDPGTSKSQLLQYSHKIAPRGMYTSGKGSSAVGLTAYVTRDIETGQMMLESGALVLSDGGICCIDEFDKMSDSTRAILHEVMEQQTVSIAKAGIICSLNARTSVLAAANPKESRYNPKLSIVENIQLPPTLLSRFDLIYLVLDRVNTTTDQRLARFLTSLYHEDRPSNPQSIATNTLARYVSYAKKYIQPRLTDAASQQLVKCYTELRNIGGSRRTITATPRQLESLIRLSEAHARMHLRQDVIEDDVHEAMRLVRVAMHQAALDPSTGLIDMELITTGNSASSRGQVSQISAELRTYINEHAKEQGGGGSIKVGTALSALRGALDIEVTESLIERALKDLEDEMFIRVIGKGKNTRFSKY